MGATRRKRQSRPRAFGSLRLHALTLATPSVTENAAPGTIVSAILGATAGSALTLADNAGGRFALSAGSVRTGAVALDRETAASHAITVRETLGGYADSPRDTVLGITVLNVFEAPDLGALSLSGTEFVAGVAAGGAIIGAVSGSVISASGLPAGLTINGPARTWAWDGSGPIAAGSLSLIEALADASNSPRVSMIGWAVVSAPSVAISSEFPVLKAAYESGGRALISWVGDSTVAFGGSAHRDEESTVGYLRAHLAAQGLAGVIGGCFSSADKGLTLASITPSDYAAFYGPNTMIDPSFNFYALSRTAFGTSHLYSTTVGDKVRYDPGFPYDRLELFYPSFPGAGSFDLKIGSTVLASIDGNQAVQYRKTSTHSVSRTNAPVDQVVTGGYGWTGTLRVWDSTAARTLQVENLGVCGYRCSDWLDTQNMYAGNQIPLIGCHLAIIQLGVNEMNLGVSAATYQANLTALINAFKAAGSDVLVCLPPPAVGGYGMDADHRGAVPAACIAAGIGAPVDLYGSIGFNTATDLVDTVHPNAGGNYKIVNGAGGVAQRLLA